MLASPPKSSRVRALGRSLVVPVVIALIAFAYAAGHLSWYRGTPLGRIPMVDEQENLMLGEMIVRGELPKEPFYRAMGYPLVLAGLRGAGIETAGLFSAALVLGILLHGINASLLAAAAQSWFGRAGAAAGGLLFALNPVLVHYATQALDATPALTCFLAGLAFLAPEFKCAGTQTTVRWRWVAASLAFAAATILRPNYLLAWSALPVIALWVLGSGHCLRGAFAALSGAMLFVAIAGWQSRVSGVVGFMPWQGAYNLWAANQPGAHGRYFVQRVSIPSSVAALNPTRAESIYFYRQETGAAPAGISALNAHWRGRFLERVRTAPLAWCGLLARKAYALLNDWDQYNNKTYAFHQARAPWLRWNPLGWGAVFVLGIAGAARLRRELPRAAASMALVSAALTAGILLFYVSGRFRLPLLAVATVLAGGAIGSPGFWRAWPRHKVLVLAAAIIFFAAVTFSNLNGVRDRTTFVEDHALLARAAERTGNLDLAWTQATAALALNPKHRDALRVAIVSFFNQLVRSGEGPGPEPQWLEIARRFLAAKENDAPELEAIAAIAMWRANERVAAVEEWRRLGRAPSAIAARLLVGDRTISRADLVAAPASGWSEPLVRLAAARLGIEPPPGVPAGDPQRAEHVLQRIFVPK
jgi:hypothetical protein